MEAGEVRHADAEALAYALMGIADFIGMRWVLWERRPPPAAVVDELMTFVRAGIEREPPQQEAPKR